MGEDSEPPAWPELIPAERATDVRRIMVMHAGDIPIEQISEWTGRSVSYVLGIVSAQLYRRLRMPVIDR
jgi:hypothetical protein